MKVFFPNFAKRRFIVVMWNPIYNILLSLFQITNYLLHKPYFKLVFSYILCEIEIRNELFYEKHKLCYSYTIKSLADYREEPAILIEFPIEIHKADISLTL